MTSKTHSAKSHGKIPVEHLHLRVQQAGWWLSNRDGAVVRSVLNNLTALLGSKQHSKLQNDVLSVHIGHKRVRNLNNGGGWDDGANLGNGQVAKDDGAVILAKLAANGFNGDWLGFKVFDLEVDSGDAAIGEGDAEGRLVVGESDLDFGLEIVGFELAVLADWRVGNLGEGRGGEEGGEKWEGSEKAHCG